MADIDKLLKEIENHKPWEYCDQWKNESQYYSWLRGRLRSIWSKDWTPKNNYLNDRKFDHPKVDEDGNPILNKTGNNMGKQKTFKAYECEITGEIIPASKPKGAKTAKYNIDHIEDAGSCRNGLEACIFLFRVLTSPDNMQLISTEAHKILTHMKRHDISWDEAVIDKKAIAWEKDKKVDHKQFLLDNGFSEEDISNGKKRKVCYLNYLNRTDKSGD